jgi:hypothetical protein
VIAERVVSVESDSETLWRTRCERKKVSNGTEFDLLGSDQLGRL